jgi:hypothetical protein
MPRTIATAFRASIDASYSAQVAPIFCTITHVGLATPIRVVSDSVDYWYGGVRFVGLMFSLSLLTDGERPPRGAIQIPNVDREISNAILAMATPAGCKIEIIDTGYFGAVDVSTTPPQRVQSSAPVPEYVADNLKLRNISGDALTVQAELGSCDLSTEPWPAIRSTKNFLPGLYR